MWACLIAEKKFEIKISVLEIIYYKRKYLWINLIK